MLNTLSRVLGAVAFAGLVAGALPAQGEFVNYEDPQVKPITIAEVGTAPIVGRYVLVCNTPDNSVEIYRATDPLLTFVKRVPVGLSPVTVRWNANLSRFYTCNYLGDSVSCVRLETIAALPGGISLRATVERTRFVGDEPTDIEFVENDTQAFVTLHSSGNVSFINLSDLSWVAPALPLIVSTPAPNIRWGLKAPRRIAVLPDKRAYVLNTQGGDLVGGAYNFSLMVSDPNNPPAGQNSNRYAVSNVGSTNFNFAIDRAGQRMVVVSQIARNNAQGVDAVAAQQTGFVQTRLQVLDLVPGTPGGPPMLVAEQTGGGPLPKPVWRSINLNRDYSQSALTEVAPGSALAQVTDVVFVEGQAVAETRLVLAAFGSDKIAILRPEPNEASGWAMTQVPIPLVDPAAGYSAVGPRGLVYDPQATEPGSGTQPGLVFGLNRLDNSLVVVNPWSGAIVQQQSLANDPTPAIIRKGRKFLYSAWFTSGNGAVSCSSCHVDGRTDGQGWFLGNLDPAGPPIPAHFHDGDDEDTASMPDFPNDKPLMVTQTLQGLVNSHLEPFGMQFVTTNAPYHWRGDKFTFQDFNEAFVRLQGRATELLPGEMDDYTKFVNTIHHPPNPEQPKDRSVGGDPGDPDNPDSGSGAQLGLKLFHILKMVGPRGCVHCHHLPDGSSNTLVLTEKQDGSLGTRQLHPFETAATRNLTAREIVRGQDGFGPTDLTSDITVTGSFGLLHAGIFSLGGAPQLSLSINDFVNRTFAPLLGDLTKGQAVTEFMRQFDTGTSPLIGVAWTVDPSSPSEHTAIFNLLEAQAREANVGVAVYTVSNNVQRGYWFDVATGVYVEEGTNNSKTRAQLEALVMGPDDAVIVQATPTGSERRVASLTGVPAPPTGPAPGNIELLPMVPNTAFVGVTDFTRNWDPNHPIGPFKFNWDESRLGAEPVSLKSIRTFQTALAGQFGVPSGILRHEAPRRLRVTGDNIRNGAKLIIGMARATPGMAPVSTIWFDLAPTRYTANGRTVWETAEELDPLHTLAWLCGGYWAPGVADVMTGVIPSPHALDPANWNLFRVSIVNRDGTAGSAPQWQSLAIADVR